MRIKEGGGYDNISSISPGCRTAFDNIEDGTHSPTSLTVLTSCRITHYTHGTHLLPYHSLHWWHSPLAVSPTTLMHSPPAASPTVLMAPTSCRITHSLHSWHQPPAISPTKPMSSTSSRITYHYTHDTPPAVSITTLMALTSCLINIIIIFVILLELTAQAQVVKKIFINCFRNPTSTCAT